MSEICCKSVCSFGAVTTYLGYFKHHNTNKNNHICVELLKVSKLLEQLLPKSIAMHLLQMLISITRPVCLTSFQTFLFQRMFCDASFDREMTLCSECNGCQLNWIGSVKCTIAKDVKSCHDIYQNGTQMNDIVLLTLPIQLS